MFSKRTFFMIDAFHCYQTNYHLAIMKTSVLTIREKKSAMQNCKMTYNHVLLINL